VTVTALPALTDHDDPRALIEEARRHRRKRLGVIGGCLAALAVLAVAAGALVGSVSSGGGGSNVVPVTPGPLFASVVTRATEQSGTAEVTLTDQYSQPGCPLSQTVSSGSIDFTRHAIATRVVSAKSRYDLCTQSTGVEVREFGAVQYQTIPPPRCRPAGCRIVSSGPAVTTRQRPWLESSPTSSEAGAVNVLQTPFALIALGAFPTTTQRGRATTILGQPAREYSASITLADLEASAQTTQGAMRRALAAITSPLGVIPPASAIPVSIHVWIDSSNRVVRLSMIQPEYMVNFVSGASSGSLQFPPGLNSPHEVPSDNPYQQGYASETIDFHAFGTSQHPVRPPSSEVSPSR
jgi:hypothetical protein